MNTRIYAILVLSCLLAGCGSQSPRSAGGDVAPDALPVLASATGGELVLLPAGSFSMGDAAGRPDETPHQVELRSFYLDRHPVTQELYEKVLGVNPSKHKDPKNPVERTQWTDAVRFCNKCSEREGLTACYDLKTWECNLDADGYRLPTEAEWEYACRAGATGRYTFGDAESELSSYAWFKQNSQGKPHPVGQKQPNRWGLYDVHGNVWQWGNDWYAENGYKESPSQNPHGPATGKQRVLRGGAWDSSAEQCRAAYRHKEFPVYSDACFGADSYGFRRARNAGPAAKPGVVVAAPKSGESEKKIVPPPVAPVAPLGSGKLDKSALKGTIVFVSDRSGMLKIWRMRADGSDAKQLTKGDSPDADPRFSPDGKRVLYTTLHEGFPEIWLMSRDGADPQFVAKGSQGNWSPDGKAIVFIRDNQTYLRDLASGKEQRVTPKDWERCGVPAFSPDGKQIAVASRHLSEIGIFLLDLDGKAVRQLKAEEACCTPQWSRDGKKMLCQTVQGHIHQVGVDGKNWEQLTFGADVQHDARYSPDERLILFCRAPSPEGPWQICVKKRDADDEDFIALTEKGSNSLPDWHADE
jgi:formylglycine-generating enzyme required for sulfatase activity